MSVKFHFFPLLILLFAFTSAFAQIQTPKSSEILNEKATILPEPVYPAAARAVRVSGTVLVQVSVDENGDVTGAWAISGHPLLRSAATQAARQAKFDPSTGKVTGTLVFVFVIPVSPDEWRFIGKALGDAEVEIEHAEYLGRAARYLASGFPEISKSIQTIADEYVKDEESARFQTNAIDDAIRRLQYKLAQLRDNSWHFELGLTVGRINANYFDEAVLRANLPKIRELMSSFSPDKINYDSLNEAELERLTKLSEMADKMFFSRKDKNRIQQLIKDL